jgi:hypothetical protein
MWFFEIFIFKCTNLTITNKNKYVPHIGLNTRDKLFIIRFNLHKDKAFLNEWS